jgi:nucleotide-binding universal stress UspA family protein
MLRFNKILVPVDFSEMSTAALDYAVDLAATFGATISVLHVYQLPVYSFPDAVLVTPASLATEISGKAQDALDALVASRKERSPGISGSLLSGAPWEEIPRFAKEQGCDLIVIATHGRRGIPRAVLGSVAERVLRTSSVPVLTIHGSHAST